MNAVYNDIRLINNVLPLFAVFNCKYGDFERFFTLKFIPKWKICIRFMKIMSSAMTQHDDNTD